MKKKLFVISMDALVHEDIAYLRTKPNFSKLMADCAEVEKVCGVYPSITYPAHAAIFTGCRPGKHGIITNTEVTSYDPPYPLWWLTQDCFKVEDIFAAAKRAGCTTASVYWPICGNNPNIDYLINEYFFYDKSEPVDAGFAKFGANEETLEVVRANMNRFPDKVKNPPCTIGATFDNFINGCTCTLIRRHQPDVILIHNCFMDSNRHRYGIFNDRVTAALDQMDLWLGEIIDAMKDAGVYDETNFVILSDHGQMNFSRRIKINTLLARGGFLTIGEDGEIADWKALSQSNGMSATVYLKDPTDKALHDEVYAYLKNLAAEGVWGFEEVLTEAETRERYNIYGTLSEKKDDAPYTVYDGFAFMVETDGYTAFADGWNEPVINPINLEDYRLGKATHGYQPEKGPQPVFLGRGPAFKAGAVLTNANIIDEAPTMARILGQEMPQAEGRVLEELLV